jgi:DNA-binding protein H-NS
MARTYRDVLNQIDRLRHEAEALRRKEIAGVVARIQQAIAAYGLTADDLGLAPSSPTSAKAARARRGAGVSPGASTGKPAGKRAGKPSEKASRKGKGLSAGSAKAKSGAGRKIPIKFRDAHGNAWSGRGSQPRWLTAAIAQGAKLEDFRVAS